MNVSNINVGIEHGNEKYRKEMLKRSMSNELIISALKILNNANIPVAVNNIMGFPDETRELKKTVVKVKIAETGSYVAISVGDLIYDMLRVDPKVIKAVDFSRKGDFSNIFYFSKKEIAERSIKSSEPLEGLHKLNILYHNG